MSVLSVENKSLSLHTRYHFLACDLRQSHRRKQTRRINKPRAVEHILLQSPRVSPMANSSVAEILAFSLFKGP